MKTNIDVLYDDTRRFDNNAIQMFSITEYAIICIKKIARNCNMVNFIKRDLKSKLP